MANRLNLDFSIITQTERADFLNKYLIQNKKEFQLKPLTIDELETMGNYVLWGKNADGLNAKQDGTVDLKARHNTWDTDQHIESLDALLESPSFNEASLGSSDSPPIHYRAKREVFSRDEALRDCAPGLRDSFRNLFRRIDETEYMINLYEFAHGKRQTESRLALGNKFSEDEVEKMRAQVSTWTQFYYLKQRHLLVDLRQEQYALRDSYATPIISSNTTIVDNGGKILDFGAGIEVFPLGLVNQGQLSATIFSDLGRLDGKKVAPRVLTDVIKFWWQKKEADRNLKERDLCIDFRNEEHIYELINEYVELRRDAQKADFESNLPDLLATFDYYMDLADLPPMHHDILEQKIRKVKNVDIAFEINHKYSKTYTPNYISTIFRQRIIPKIADAAKYHEEFIGLLSFPEEFKQCSVCGRILVKDEKHFTHKTRSKDGYTSRCKKCERIARNGKNREEI